MRRQQEQQQQQNLTQHQQQAEVDSRYHSSQQASESSLSEQHRELSQLTASFMRQMGGSSMEVDQEEEVQFQHPLMPFQSTVMPQIQQQQPHQPSSQPSSQPHIPQPIPSILLRLQHLSTQIQSTPHYPIQPLREYITLYVQHHTRSQQFFNLMCEHNMMAKLFSGVSRPIHVLETFNLLLANTQQVSELVYIFSHPLFHNYLMINVETVLQGVGGVGSGLGVGLAGYGGGGNGGSGGSGNSSSVMASNQCIEYYIQLIKTLVTKLEAQSTHCTLLKLFCNSKYSYFPLLTNCIILAIKRNVKQQLVRVTAQHCILQLIGIMVRKNVGECYLYGLHMMVFFSQLIMETIEEETGEKEEKKDTTIKYVVDLIRTTNTSASPSTTQKSNLLFFTILSNLLTIRFMKHPAPALQLLTKLTTLFRQLPQLSQIPSLYLSPIYYIFGKLLFNKYLNNVTLSAIILVGQAVVQLEGLKDVNVLRIVKGHYERNPLVGGEIEIEGDRGQRDSLRSISSNKSIGDDDKEGIKKEKSNSYNYSNNYSNNNSNNKTKNHPFNLFTPTTKPRPSSSTPSTQHPLPFPTLLPHHSTILSHIQRYNMDNEQFFTLKQTFYKKSASTSSSPTSGWLSGIGNLFKKINIFDIATSSYMKHLAHLCAVRYIPERQIRFLQQVFAPTAVYLYEYVKTINKERYLFGQKSEDTEKVEISFNENRDQFVADGGFFKVMVGLGEVLGREGDRGEEMEMEGEDGERFEKQGERYDEMKMNSEIKKQSRINMIEKLQKHFHPTLPLKGQVYFTLHFRQYFQHSIFQYVCSSPTIKHRTQLTPKTISYLYKLSSLLQFQLSDMNTNKIKQEILKLEKELVGIIDEKGTEGFCEYLDSGREKRMVGESEEGGSMQVSVMKFDRSMDREGNSNNRKSAQSSSGSKKRRSIFKTLTSRSSNSSNSTTSPAKDPTSPLYGPPCHPHDPTSSLPMIQTRMLHLQLLRHLLAQSPSLPTSLRSFTQPKPPLYRIFQHKFTRKYGEMLDNTEDREVLYRVGGVGFNGEGGCEVRVRVDWGGFGVWGEVGCEGRVVLRCDVREFCLSEPYLFMESVGMREEGDRKSGRVINIGYDNSKNNNHNNNTTNTMKKHSSLPSPPPTQHQPSSLPPTTTFPHLLTIFPTTNTLGFTQRGKAFQFMNTINQIKFGLKELRDAAVYEYLGKEEG